MPELPLRILKESCSSKSSTVPRQNSATGRLSSEVPLVVVSAPSFTDQTCGLPSHWERSPSNSEMNCGVAGGGLSDTCRLDLQKAAPARAMIAAKRTSTIASDGYLGTASGVTDGSLTASDGWSGLLPGNPASAGSSE